MQTTVYIAIRHKKRDPFALSQPPPFQYLEVSKKVDPRTRKIEFGSGL